MNCNNGLPKYCHYLALACATVVATLVFALPAEHTNPGPAGGQSILKEIKQIPLRLPEAPKTALSSSHSLEDNLDLEDWHTAIVQPGDSLSLIFSRLGLSIEDLYSLLSSSEEAEALTLVRPGQSLKIRMDTTGRLIELIHETDQIQGTRIVREGEVFKLSAYIHEIEKRTAFSTGTIKRSLYQSALEAGLSDRLIMELVEIFGWDIDFALNIRPGDSFTVIYEEHYLAGEKLGSGNILAAEFINQDKPYRAVRYTDVQGATHYYTPEGRSMRQAFLRSPVDFRRISSHFQPNRLHPVLGIRRPHMGVDYAAATGTPIKASGAGKVEFIGKKGGYGNTIILQHGNRYTTLYAHMSGFNQQLRKSSQVKQGDIIGYVGMTGLASGPHLHYEFRINGVHVDPVTAKLPGAPPIEPRYKADFRKHSEALVTQLDVYQRTRLAMNSSYSNLEH